MNTPESPTPGPATPEMLQAPEMLQEVMKLQVGIRNDVMGQMQKQSMTDLSKVVETGAGDVTYKIDKNSEGMIKTFGEQMGQRFPLAITAEGPGRKEYGEGKPQYEFLMDPIDGTRGIMYDMRSAWALTGIAKARQDGKPPTMADIEMACMTEIPTTKQDRASVVYAVKGQGAVEEIWDIRNNKLIEKRKLQASKAETLEDGFATFVDFFPGCSREVSDIKENVFEKVIGPVKKGKALVFDDQYISNAGQMYSLITGRYRFVADLRPELERVLKAKGKELGLAAHPYDLSTALIAQEAGAIITDAKGNDLAYSFDPETNCTWIGYANETLRKKIEPTLQAELAKLPKAS